jgi:hypothetical protein
MAAAVPFKPAAKAASTDPDEGLRKEMDKLLTRARLDRARHQSRIADCYRYTMPWRHSFNQNQPANTFDEIFDETPAIVLEDFAADMLNTFTPQKNNWLSEEPSITVHEGDKGLVAKQVKIRQAVIFAEMSKSSLYQALQEAYLDLGPGTMAMLIQDIDAAKPVHCEAIPISDLLITRGPYGMVDGTFRDEKTYLRGEAKVLWPDAEWSKLGSEPQDGDAQELKITDGCWRDWKEKGTETYTYAVLCQSKIVHRKRYTGAGSCPFIVGGWSRDPTTAWRIGPTYRVLPAIKTVNHVRFLDLKNYDKHVDPPTSYEDDGVMNVDGGVRPGDWIPARSIPSRPKRSRVRRVSTCRCLSATNCVRSSAARTTRISPSSSARRRRARRSGRTNAPNARAAWARPRPTS